jgi:uncharacterized protein (TIGR02284 family)
MLTKNLEIMRNTEPIYDLLQINIDRVVDYERASAQTIVEEVNSLFSEMANQSRNFINQLQKLLRTEGDDPAEGRTQRGKIYNNWADTKVNLNADEKKGLLAVCEKGEVAVKNSYTLALKKIKSTGGEICQVIEDQKKLLENRFKEIKDIRSRFSV